MASKTTNTINAYTVRIEVDATGNPQHGIILIHTDDGHSIPVTIGPGGNIAFGSLGTAGQRAGFIAVVAAAVTAAHTAKGFA